MFETWNQYLSPLVIVLATVASAVALLHVSRLRQRLITQQARLESLGRDIQALCEGARGMGDNLSGLERRMKKLSERQDQFALQDPENRPYHQAIRLVGDGAGVEDLVGTCGLSRSEAELIHLLHQQEATSV